MNSQKGIPLKNNIMLNLLRRLVKHEETEELQLQLIHYLKKDVKKYGTDFICLADLLKRSSMDFKILTNFHVNMMNHQDQKVRDVYAGDFYYVITHNNFSQTDFGKYFIKKADYYKNKYGSELDTLSIVN